MSGIPDLELAPDSDFADSLEQALMAEMGWQADINLRPRSVVQARPAARIRRFGITIAAALVAASVVGLLFIDRDDSRPVPRVVATEPTTTAAPSPTLAATVPTTVPTTTAAPATTEAVPPGMPIAKPLPAGTTYRIGRSVLRRSIEITNPLEGAWGQWDTGGFVLTSSSDGYEVLLAGLDLTKARFFTDPLVDANAFPDVAALTAATSEPPDDFLTYFAALPGVETDDISDTEFAGHPARALSWRFGAFEGGSPCRPSGNCVHAVWFAGTRRDGGWISSYTTGDAGTTYVLDLDGQTLIFEVQDRPGAQQAADSLVIAD